MTREEMKIIMSVYQIWLTEKKEELFADLCGTADPEPKRKANRKKSRSKHAVTALPYEFAL